MERVTGIGGIFFKSSDRDKLAAWYRDNLGVELQPFGGAVFRWAEHDRNGDAATVWNPFAPTTSYFEPSTKGFMVNFRVNDLEAMMAQLRENNVQVDPQTEDTPLGKFGWAMDPEGNKIELWEPAAPGSAPEKA